MKQILKRIKWSNVMNAILMTGCLDLIITDMYQMAFKHASLTYLGGITFFMALVLAMMCEQSIRDNMAQKKKN